MKKNGVNVIFLICSFLAVTVSAHNYTPDQQKKILQIQQAVRHDLMIGNIEQARSQLNETASNFHSEELELAMVQTLMQAGEYRNALGIAAHIQAEHQDFSDATLMYAWLLAIGGQAQPAKKLLTSSLEKHPHPDLKRILTQLNSGQLNSTAFTSANMQLHPVPSENPVIKNKFLGTGIIVDAKYILVNRSSLAKHKNFIVRDSLGHVFNAEIDNTFTDEHLARLIIENFITSPGIPKIVDKIPFPGVPVYTAGFTHDAKPNWPQLAVDILGSPIEGKEKLYSLNNQNLAYGTGIYSLSGLLVGIVVSDGSTTRKVRMLVNDSIKNNVITTSAIRMPADQVYERSMKTTLQLFADQ